VTTVLGHGNTDPYTDRPEHIRRKIEVADDDALIDFGCFAWITPENFKSLEPLIDAGAVGLQASLDERALSAGQLLTAMEKAAALDQRIGIHVEHGSIIDQRRNRLRSEGNGAPIDHCRSRPVVAESLGAATVLELARETGCPLHIFQVSSASALERLERGRQANLDITLETTPHYCWFSDTEMEKQGSVAVVSPPLREEGERVALLDGLAAGRFDCLGTDHAPHTDEEKRVDRPYDSVWGVSPGFVGVETAHAAALTLVDRGHLSLPQWIRLHSTTPARIWGCYPNKGSLEPGTDADIIIVEPDQEWRIDRQNLNSKSTATIWDGEAVTGTVTTTLVRGTVVYDEDSFSVEPGYGEHVN
jgi:dihydroorotase/allantoinase